MAEHLFDQVRPYLRRPVEERVAFIRWCRFAFHGETRTCQPELEHFM
jgi:hypothetical protein